MSVEIIEDLKKINDFDEKGICPLCGKQTDFIRGLTDETWTIYTCNSCKGSFKIAREKLNKMK